MFVYQLRDGGGRNNRSPNIAGPEGNFAGVRGDFARGSRPRKNEESPAMTRVKRRQLRGFTETHIRGTETLEVRRIQSSRTKANGRRTNGHGLAKRAAVK